MSDTHIPDKPIAFERVHLSQRDLEVLAHSIYSARVLGHTPDRRALQVHIDTVTGHPITPDDAAHAVEWAVAYQRVLRVVL